MAASTNPTFDEVDKHVQSVDLAALNPGGKHHPAASPTSAAATLPQICPAYKSVRPILVIISNTSILPQKWRDVLKAFIGVVDVVCP